MNIQTKLSMVYGVLKNKYGLTRADIRGRSRIRDRVFSRIAINKLLRSSGYTTLRCGKEVGRDHSTSVYYLNEHTTMYKSTSHDSYTELYDELEKIFKMSSSDNIEALFHTRRWLSDKRDEIERDIMDINQRIEAITKKELRSYVR